MDEHIIKTEDLCKTYSVRNYDVKGMKRFSKEGKKDICALKKLNIEIDQGKIVGLIGANGAGKSTTIKLLTGILSPTSGSVLTFGKDPAKFRRKIANNIGVMMGQRSQLWWDIPAIDSFKLYAKMYGVKSEDYNSRINFFNEILDCNTFSNRPVRQLSLGQRMRCEMIAALIHNPSLVFLDEPTIGIDILAKEKILEFIQLLNKKFGTTVILTTHDIADMGKISEHIIIMDKGVSVYDGSKDKLLQFNRYDRVTFKFETPPNKEELKKKYPLCNFENEVQVVFTNNNEIIPTSTFISEIMTKYKIIDINLAKTDIETVVKKIYSDNKKDERYDFERT